MTMCRAEPPPSRQRARLRACLHTLQTAMQGAQMWQARAPSAQALASTLPFMYDTMRIHEWLQWVFIPRLHALLDAGTVLPGSCSVHPLAEHEWAQQAAQPAVAQALAALHAIDQLLTDDTDTGIDTGGAVVSPCRR